MKDKPARIGVIVASVGRPEEVRQLLEALRKQSVEPAEIVLSINNPGDLPNELRCSIRPGIKIVEGPAGLPAQRNRGLDLIQSSCDVVLFYDDDFLPARDSLECVWRFFEKHADVVGVTGHVLADGVNGPGLDYQEASDILRDYEKKPKPALLNEDFLCAYGCNMAFRCTAIGTRRFDERLPRYGWQEDMDFAGQLAKVGKVIRTNAFAGVHRGVKKSRGRGEDLGYSQIINPVYLVRKGTMTWRKALVLIARNLIANHVKVLRPEPYVDRWGRLCGNWTGLLFLLRGEVDPMALPSTRYRG